MKVLTHYLSIFAASFLGMFLGYGGFQWLTGSPPAYAQNSNRTISSMFFRLVDAQGRKRGVIGASTEGSPGIWLFDKNGVARLNMGLYPDQNSYIVLNDKFGRAVQIFRTIGGSNAPVLVMKANGRDRIVMGLNWKKNLEPFLRYYEHDGTPHSLFGK